MQPEPQVAFARPRSDAPAVEVVVNFGVFAGRAATPAEIEALAQALLPLVGEVAIVAEERHEIGEESEAALHQVRIELGSEQVPTDAREAGELERRIVEAAGAWARACVAERRAEMGDL